MPTRDELGEMLKSMKFSFSFKTPSMPTRRQLDLFYRSFRFVIADDMEKARELGWKKLLITLFVTGLLFGAFVLFKYYVFFG